MGSPSAPDFRAGWHRLTPIGRSSRRTPRRDLRLSDDRFSWSQGVSTGHCPGAPNPCRCREHGHAPPKPQFSDRSRVLEPHRCSGRNPTTARRSRSSSCATNWPCCNAEPHGHGPTGPTEPWSPPSLGCSRLLAAWACWSPRPRSCAGADDSSPTTGPPRTPVHHRRQGDRRCLMRLWVGLAVRLGWRTRRELRLGPAYCR